MKEPDNYSELLQAVKLIAEHCEVVPCKDCPFYAHDTNECILRIDVPFHWLYWLPGDMKGVETK